MTGIMYVGSWMTYHVVVCQCKRTAALEVMKSGCLAAATKGRMEACVALNNVEQ